MKVTAIVVNRDQAALLRQCLESLRAALAATGEVTETFVVDNASEDMSRGMVTREFPDAQLIGLDENVGFPQAVNVGLARARGEWVLLLNNDATIERDAIRHVLDLPLADDVGTVALQIRFATRPDLINSAGIGLDALLVPHDRLLGEPVAGEARHGREVFGACAGGALYRRAMLDEIGGMDGRLFLYLDDVDVAWRARMAGWRAVYVPEAVVWHHHSTTTRHGSGFKYFYVGRNRVRLLALHADRRHLLRHGPAILAYELAYVAYAALADRSLAPLRGRLAGLREWRALRAEGAARRRPVAVDPAHGLRGALRRRRAWLTGGTPPPVP
ncbi:MAG TPA: glycosyltransferase family 2 protein [Solirubrobacteraceae bacterium]|nr:glycosyltransferase family 2 protein [Solirubrobacteraceae bacterium]